MAKILTADELAERGIYIVPVPGGIAKVLWRISRIDGDDLRWWGGKRSQWTERVNACDYCTPDSAREAASELVAKAAEPKEPTIEVWWRNPDSCYISSDRCGYGCTSPAPVLRHPDGRVEVKEVVPDTVLGPISDMLDGTPVGANWRIDELRAWLRDARAVAAKVKEATG